MPKCLILTAADVLPPQWKNSLDGGRVHVFNPGLLRHEGGWLFAYRFVGTDRKRRIGLCRLDLQFRVVAGSQAPLSDGIVFDLRRRYSERITSWFADPRLYRFEQRVFLYWNTGWHEPQNQQFLHELNADDLTLVGEPREFRLLGERQPIEKNWMLFGEQRSYAVYSIAPHRILSFSLEGHGDICFEEEVTTEWGQNEYFRPEAKLRGSAPPQRVGDHYYSVCHYIVSAPEGYCYRPAVYRFSASRPFEPTGVPLRDLPLSNPFGPSDASGRLNPAIAEVLYPCGAAYEAHCWVISYGINDEYCALGYLTDEELNGCWDKCGSREG